MNDQRTVSAWHIADGATSPCAECVAEETAIALIFNGVPHAVMMASPGDLADFALGFALTEGIVEKASEFELVEILPRDAGIAVHCLIPEERHAALRVRSRSLPGRSGCGLCGAETLEQAIRPISKVQIGRQTRAADISAAIAQLSGLQTLNQATGALHAAALVDGDGIIVREDIGRHNALDKLVGAMSREERSPGFLLMSSRASYEIVHKAAAANFPLIAAISAPSAFAIRLADESGITLIGFARDARMTVYTHIERMV